MHQQSADLKGGSGRPRGGKHHLEAHLGFVGQRKRRAKGKVGIIEIPGGGGGKL
jgi:hypothetical protein